MPDFLVYVLNFVPAAPKFARSGQRKSAMNYSMKPINPERNVCT